MSPITARWRSGRRSRSKTSAAIRNDMVRQPIPPTSPSTASQRGNCVNAIPMPGSSVSSASKPRTTTCRSIPILFFDYADAQENLPPAVAAEARSAIGPQTLQYRVLPIDGVEKVAVHKTGATTALRRVPEARPTYSGANGRPYPTDQRGRSAVRPLQFTEPLPRLSQPEVRTGTPSEKTLTKIECL